MLSEVEERGKARQAGRKRVLDHYREREKKRAKIFKEKNMEEKVRKW